MAGEGQSIEFTMQEWEQAWSHTRHLESLRGQYLGFFFTAVLGVTAIAGPGLADDSLRTSAALLTAASLAVGLQLVSGFIYLAVVRINEVLGYYHEIIEIIKGWMIQGGAAVDLARFVKTPRPRHPWARTSRASERVLEVGLAGFPLVLIATLVRSVEATGASFTTLACAAATALAILVGIFVWLGGTTSAAE